MSVARLSLITTLCQALGMLIALAVQVLLAAGFGTSAAMDAYVAATALPNVLSVVLSTAIYRGGLPLVVEWRRAEGSWRVLSGVFNWLAVWLGLLALGLGLGAPWLMTWLTPGLEPVTRHLAATLLQWLSVTLWAGGVSAWLANLEYAEGRFLKPSLGFVVQISLTYVCVLAWAARLGVLSVALGAALGSLAQVAMLAPALLRPGRYAFIWQEALPQARRFLSLAGPLVAGAIFYKLTLVLEKTFASFLPTGSMAALGYAYKPIPLVLAVITSGFATVVFPLNSRLASSGSHEELRRSMEHSLTLLAVAVTPVVVGLWLFRVPLVAWLFQRGEFTGLDAWLTSSLLGWYALALWFMALSTVPSQIYGIHQRTRVLIPIGIGQTIAYLLYAGWLVRQAGVHGLAGAFALYYAISWTINMVICLRWIPGLQPWVFLRRPLTAAAVGVGLGMAFGTMSAGWQTVWQGAGFLALYSGVLWAILRSGSWTDLWEWCRASSAKPATGAVSHAVG